MFCCEDNSRDTATLIPLIHANIKPGTRIISDQWGVYWDNNNHRLQLLNYGYLHETVNHSEEFVNWDDPKINTQIMECFWRHMKTPMRKGGIPLMRARVNTFMRFIIVMSARSMALMCLRLS
jgi:hypothetical protein